MRILLGLAATLISTSAFAHSGHGELEAMHHGVFSPLNGLEPLAAVVAGAALVAYVAWKRR
ncbi:MAG: HupE/UreJ family protein [Rhizobiaceae bacterium]